MRYIGLDLGTKTIGVALSDETLTISSPLKTIRFVEGDFNSAIPEIGQLIKQFNVKKIILGLPKNMNNTIGESGNRALMFKDTLESNLDVSVIMQDERLSTVEATNYMLQADISRKKRKQKIDGLAANIILQTYLDKEKGRG